MDGTRRVRQSPKRAVSQSQSDLGDAGAGPGLRVTDARSSGDRPMDVLDTAPPTSMSVEVVWAVNASPPAALP